MQYSIIPHFLYPFICQWTFKLLPCLGCCKQCSNEHWGACILSDLFFSRYIPRNRIARSHGTVCCFKIFLILFNQLINLFGCIRSQFGTWDICCIIWDLLLCAWAQQLQRMGLVALPHVGSQFPWTEPTCPAFQGRFLTTRPPETSPTHCFYAHW